MAIIDSKASSGTNLFAPSTAWQFLIQRPPSRLSIAALDQYFVNEARRVDALNWSNYLTEMVQA
jgi:hypothetical protein